jgi:hypothetical protein
VHLKKRRFLLTLGDRISMSLHPILMNQIESKQNSRSKSNETEINIDYVLILSRTKPSNFACFYKRIEIALFLLTSGGRISMSL